MSDSLKYTTAQKITLKNCFYALMALIVFTIIMLCLTNIFGFRDSPAYKTTPFFEPFKIILSFSIVLFTLGQGFGGIIDIYKKNQSTILIKHFSLRYFIQYSIIALALYLFIYSIGIMNSIEIKVDPDWAYGELGIIKYLMIGVLIIVIVSALISILNNKKDYIKIDTEGIEFFDSNSLIHDKENTSQKNNIDLISVNKKDVKKVELKFSVYKSSKFLKSIKFILKNKKEVVMDLEEMSLSSYDKVIQNEISSRYNGMILETYGSKK
jgi:hypothetical protein